MRVGFRVQGLQGLGLRIYRVYRGRFGVYRVRRAVGFIGSRPESIPKIRGFLVGKLGAVYPPRNKNFKGYGLQSS